VNQPGTARTIVELEGIRKHYGNQVHALSRSRRGAMGLIGLVTGVVKGVLDIYFMSRTAAGIFGGYSIPFYFSGKLLALSTPIVMIVALAAAWWPARVASRTNVVAAIGSE
jgi:ABC-type antimicrobial peptide transport system permease subunit